MVGLDYVIVQEPKRELLLHVGLLGKKNRLEIAVVTGVDGREGLAQKVHIFGLNRNCGS